MLGYEKDGNLGVEAKSVAAEDGEQEWDPCECERAKRNEDKKASVLKLKHGGKCEIEDRERDWNEKTTISKT